jgi:hypothetical protein
MVPQIPCSRERPLLPAWKAKKHSVVKERGSSMTNEYKLRMAAFLLRSVEIAGKMMPDLMMPFTRRPRRISMNGCIGKKG